MYKRYWLARYNMNGFEMKIFFYGTEEEMQDYMISEFGHTLGYHGATDEEVQAGKLLKMKFYLV